jgi:NADPH:quinone reductase-like Zn-dependent oxidoreductase
MSKAQVIHKLGPPSAMQWQDWPVPDPGPGEVRLRHTAVGVNFADTYHRGGISHPWPVPAPSDTAGSLHSRYRRRHH